MVTHSTEFRELVVAFARRVMADHRAQLPSEARDLYGGGCGCPQCEQARDIIAKAEGRGWRRQECQPIPDPQSVIPAQAGIQEKGATQ